MDAKKGYELSRRTVVVVDDVAQIRSMLTRVIHRSPQLRVVGEAADFEAAFELLEATMPDIAVVDRRVDDTDPVAAVAALRARFPDTVLVLLSGTPRSDVEPALLDAVDAFADKLAPLGDTVALLELLTVDRRRRAGA